MKSFLKQIKPAVPSESDVKNRRWIYVPYDRYTDRVGPIAEQAAADTGLVIVESTAKAHRRPYHKKKLVLLISNMRHFALEQAQRGCAVLYHFSPLSHGQALVGLQQERGLPELTVMRPAERELRLDLAQAAERGLRLRQVPDATWLSSVDDFVAVYGEYKTGKSYVMDRFYRRLREKSRILMQGSKPAGDKFVYDSENRKPFKGELPVPIPPAFAPDALTREVIDYIESEYPHHFGQSENFDMPVTQEDCDRMWTFALERLLPVFGPFEDAMRTDEPQLFHSRTSALVNLGRMLPAQMIADVEAAWERGEIPLASAEGFIRQLLGWREFMRHIHEQTDGYRKLAVRQESGAGKTRPAPVQEQAQSGKRRPPSTAARSTTAQEADPYAGAKPSALGASLPLPAVYWGVKSGMHCVDTVVAQVIEEGWSHHITRLMVLSNLATLCGFSPRELTDWFWFAYVDAYDWVVETNVLGMATYADGGLTATKPYVSGAAYINRMSNFCGSCQYDPKRATGPGSCPFTALYWTFLERNQAELSGNFRLQMPYATLRKKPAAELVALRTRAGEAIAHLASFRRPDY